MGSKLSLRQLEAILAIAEHGSFIATAAKLHVSQPALSRTVQLTEESLRARIFDREMRKVSNGTVTNLVRWSSDLRLSLRFQPPDQFINRMSEGV